VAVRAAQATFLASAITMTWQLAIVIIIPIVVGFKLDKHLHSSPLWTLIGLAIAALGMGAVLWQSVRAVSPKSVAEHK
jgi:F0F1-type ATP synthase assembly protein I